jgi:hypothetical protein
MQRLRLYDVRTSRLNSAVGLCQGDVAEFAKLVNAAQRRLLYAPQAGEEGWWGGWAEIAFDVAPNQPVFTLPREIARLQNVTVNNNPVSVQNHWFEFIEFGNGRLANCVSCGPIQILSRNNAITAREMTDAPQILRFYPQSPNDEQRRIFLQGTNASGEVIRSEDNLGIVQGVYLALNQPFVETPFGVQSISGLQKEVTAGEVRVTQIDPVTGDEIDLHVMEPSETTAWYRRYKLSSIQCTTDTVQLRAIAKLDLIPVKMDSDYLLIQELEAVIEECMAIHYLSTDTDGGKAFALLHHRNAIGLLNGQLRHYLGDESPTIQANNFGSARLERYRIGTLI